MLVRYDQISHLSTYIAHRFSWLGGLSDISERTKLANVNFVKRITLHYGFYRKYLASRAKRNRNILNTMSHWIRLEISIKDLAATVEIIRIQWNPSIKATQDGGLPKKVACHEG